MKFLFYFILIVTLLPLSVFANNDTTNIPLGRQIFHDRIKTEQKRADKADGHLDGMIKVGNNPEINLQVTDAIIRKVNVLRNDIESNDAIPTNNDKVRYLRYLEYLVRDFINNWKAHKLTPSLAPLLVENFQEVLKANIKGENMSPLIQKVPYEVGLINAYIFEDNPGYKESQIILFRKFCAVAS